MSFWGKIFKLPGRIYLWLDSRFNGHYVIDGFDMDMGKNHRLKYLQYELPMYDRFVGYLANIADADEWIIDIGANVGDTAAAMIKHTEGSILCIEAAKVFFTKLVNNVKGFGDLYGQRIRTANALISNSNGLYSIEVHNGTGVKASKGSGVGDHSYSIPQVIENEGISIENVAIIKTDTDGYDYECILSLGEELIEISPVLYWENSIIDLISYEGYIKLNRYLESCGYFCCWIFDNMGNLLTAVETGGGEAYIRFG